MKQAKAKLTLFISLGCLLNPKTGLQNLAWEILGDLHVVLGEDGVLEDGVIT